MHSFTPDLAQAAMSKPHLRAGLQLDATYCPTRQTQGWAPRLRTAADLHRSSGMLKQSMHLPARNSACMHAHLAVLDQTERVASDSTCTAMPVLKKVRNWKQCLHYSYDCIGCTGGQELPHRGVVGTRVLQARQTCDCDIPPAAEASSARTLASSKAKRRSWPLRAAATKNSNTPPGEAACTRTVSNM